MAAHAKTVMTKNSRLVYVTAIIAAAIIVVLLILVWSNRFSPEVHACADGPHTTIDARDFRTRYFAYSLELEASLADRGKLAGKLEPHQLQQVSEALQTANEFRKWLVAGYNSCAITSAQFAEFGVKFQRMDQLSRQIETLSQKSHLDPAETKTLASLVEEYRTTALDLHRSN